MPKHFHNKISSVKPMASPRKQWIGLFDPRITEPSPSIYLFLKNRRSGFKIVPELREGTPVVVPPLRSPDSIQRDLNEFGLLIRDEEPFYTSEYPVVESVLDEFKSIKQRILGKIIHVLCNKDLISKYDYIITNSRELTEYGMMRPSYIQLKFHDVEDRDAVLAILSPK
jgi:hypothetical protein